MKALLTIIAVMVLVGCGTANPEGYQTAQEQQQQISARGSQLSTSDYFMVEGYVTPINIQVDGKTYQDSEDFYTKELNRLKALVKAQYPGYTLTFDAQVGLRNFKTGMYAFLAATDDVGVASEAYVDSTGKFSFMLDGKTDKAAQYTLRATKRIGLTLAKKGEDTIAWCYNMYAEKNVALNGQTNILRNFVTSITEYQCSDNAGGITLPDNSITPEQEAQIAQQNAAAAETAANTEVQAAALEQDAKDTAAILHDHGTPATTK